MPQNTYPPAKIPRKNKCDRCCCCYPKRFFAPHLKSFSRPPRCPKCQTVIPTDKAPEKTVTIIRFYFSNHHLVPRRKLEFGVGSRPILAIQISEIHIAVIWILDCHGDMDVLPRFFYVLERSGAEKQNKKQSGKFDGNGVTERRDAARREAWTLHHFCAVSSSHRTFAFFFNAVGAPKRSWCNKRIAW